MFNVEKCLSHFYNDFYILHNVFYIITLFKVNTILNSGPVLEYSTIQNPLEKERKKERKREREKEREFQKRSSGLYHRHLKKRHLVNEMDVTILASLNETNVHLLKHGILKKLVTFRMDHMVISLFGTFRQKSSEVKIEYVAFFCKGDITFSLGSITTVRASLTRALFNVLSNQAMHLKT